MDKEFKFEVFINGQLINMIKAGYLESTLRSVPENKSLLIDIWNVVDNSVRNLIKNGLYKDTTLEKAIIDNTTRHKIRKSFTLTDLAFFTILSIFYPHFFISNLYPIPLTVSIYFPFFPNLCLIFFI